jgi:hypothetical protein
MTNFWVVGNSKVRFSKLGRVQIIIREQKSNHPAGSVRIVIAKLSPFGVARNRTIVPGLREKLPQLDPVLS